MSRPALEVADVVRARGRQFLKRYKSSLSDQFLKAFRAVERCRTAALGGLKDKCVGCEGRPIEIAGCLGFLVGTVESWHLLLRPFRHHGECNYIQREIPGELFEVSEEGCGGPLVVVTTAGYELGFEANMDRVVAFRHKADNVGAWMKELEGCLFSRAFTPHMVAYDGFTASGEAMRICCVRLTELACTAIILMATHELVFVSKCEFRFCEPCEEPNRAPSVTRQASAIGTDLPSRPDLPAH